MSDAGLLGWIIAAYIWLFANPIVSLTLYFLPIIIALIRKHKSTGMIVIIGLLFGWIFLLWLILILWAAFGERISLPDQPEENNLTDEQSRKLNEKMKRAEEAKARAMSMFKGL